VTGYRLTEFSSGGGCACKYPPDQLEQLLAALPSVEDPSVEVLVGLESADDAAVILWAEQALIHTIDVITPVLDDAYEWGRVAAANSLSDVYAMGGKPLMAMNLLAWPREGLPLEVAQSVLRGGAEVAARAGCLVGGGHTIYDEEPKYGMSVIGVAKPDHLLRIDAGRPGDSLVLTKPLGLGVLTALHMATKQPIPEAISVMTSLNASASEAAIAVGARCATDVTGFGFLGHLLRIAEASQVTVIVDSKAVPLLSGACEAAQSGYVPGGTYRNLEWISASTDWGSVDEVSRVLLADAQTSGGLVVAGNVPGIRIGELVRRRSKAIVVI